MTSVILSRNVCPGVGPRTLNVSCSWEIYHHYRGRPLFRLLRTATLPEADHQQTSSRAAPSAHAACVSRRACEELSAHLVLVSPDFSRASFEAPSLQQPRRCEETYPDWQKLTLHSLKAYADCTECCVHVTHLSHSLIGDNMQYSRSMDRYQSIEQLARQL